MNAGDLQRGVFFQGAWPAGGQRLRGAARVAVPQGDDFACGRWRAGRRLMAVSLASVPLLVKKLSSGCPGAIWPVLRQIGLRPLA